MRLLSASGEVEMSQALSRETRTIIFTDVVGSTSLRTERGDDVADEVLRAHQLMVREEVSRHGGRVANTTGDGFMLAFGSVRAALAWMPLDPQVRAFYIGHRR
jgi:class 3 adenylate cyclase